jgi:hypothetical protein
MPQASKPPPWHELEEWPSRASRHVPCCSIVVCEPLKHHQGPSVRPPGGRAQQSSALNERASSSPRPSRERSMGCPTRERPRPSAAEMVPRRRSCDRQGQRVGRSVRAASRSLADRLANHAEISRPEPRAGDRMYDVQVRVSSPSPDQPGIASDVVAHRVTLSIQRDAHQTRPSRRSCTHANSGNSIGFLDPCARFDVRPSIHRPSTSRSRVGDLRTSRYTSRASCSSDRTSESPMALPVGRIADGDAGGHGSRPVAGPFKQDATHGH